MADRVLSPGQKAGYALGGFGAAVLNLMIATWPLYFYSPPPGVGRQLLPVCLSALALTAGRVVDALADPVVGYASDHTRSPWGRRLPYLVGGWVPLTLVFLASGIPLTIPASATSRPTHCLTTLPGFWAGPASTWAS
ncbi:MAG: MFS transporter [Bacillota bacterium]